METETRTSLSELIAQQVERANGSLDIEDMAARIVRQLSPDELQERALHDIRDHVARWVASRRPPTSSEGNESARWNQVRESRDLLDEWWVSFQGRAPKPLLDCSPEDLDDAAEWYEVRATGYAARAEAYRKLAKRTRRAGGSVGDLPREDVRRLLNA